MKEKLIDFLNHYFDVDKITDDTNIFQLGYVNSLFSMQLIMFLENNFGISIEPSDLNVSNFLSINNIIEFINRKTNV